MRNKKKRNCLVSEMIFKINIKKVKLVHQRYIWRLSTKWLIYLCREQKNMILDIFFFCICFYSCLAKFWAPVQTCTTAADMTIRRSEIYVIYELYFTMEFEEQVYSNLKDVQEWQKDAAVWMEVADRSVMVLECP